MWKTGRTVYGKHSRQNGMLCPVAMHFALTSVHACVQQAIFPGDSELQQLLHIFKLLGTPSEEVWPNVTRLRDWHEFPNWTPQDLTKVGRRLASSLLAAVPPV